MYCNPTYQIKGGNFGSGFISFSVNFYWYSMNLRFASGAVSSLISSGVQSLGTNAGEFSIFSDKDVIKAVTIASGGLSGGISSSITGGDFWKGTRQGLITSGLNHAEPCGVYLQNNAFITNKKLFYVLGHEYVHTIHYWSGLYSNARDFLYKNKHAGSLTGAGVIFREYSEYLAYSWSAEWGDYSSLLDSHRASSSILIKQFGAYENGMY